MGGQGAWEGCKEQAIMAPPSGHGPRLHVASTHTCPPPTHPHPPPHPPPTHTTYMSHMCTHTHTMPRMCAGKMGAAKGEILPADDAIVFEQVGGWGRARARGGGAWCLGEVAAAERVVGSGG